MDRQIIALMVEPIKRDLGLSDTQMGLLQGLAFALMYSIAGLPIGWAVDRYSRRWVLFLGITVWSISAASCGLARDFWQLSIGRSLVGAGEATVAPSAVSLIGDLFPPDRIGAPSGVFAAGFSIGNGVALIVGGLIVGLFASRTTVLVPLIGAVAPWQAVFLVAGLPGMAIAFLAFTLRDPGRSRLRSSPVAERSNSDLRTFLQSRAKVVALTFAAFTVATLVSYSIGSWTPAYLSRIFGWSPERIGATFGVALASAGVLGSVIGGVLIDRVHRAGRHDASLIVAAGCVAASTPLLVGSYFVPSPDWALGCLALGLIPYSAVAAASYATWRLIAPQRLRGRVTAGFVLTASLFGTSVGPIAVGVITDQVFHDEKMVGMSIALVLTVCLPLIVVLLLAGRASLRAIVGQDGNTN